MRTEIFITRHNPVMGTNQINLETNILITVCVLFQKFYSKTMLLKTQSEFREPSVIARIAWVGGAACSAPAVIPRRCRNANVSFLSLCI